MNIRSVYIVMLSGLLYATSGIGADMAGPVIFDDIDIDHSGCISRDEAKVRDDLIANFDDIDTNDNGTICVDEYTAYHNKDRLIPEEVEIPELGAAPVR